MLKDFLEKLTLELNSSFIEVEKNLSFTFSLTSDIQVDIKKMGEIIYFSGIITNMKEDKKEELYTYVMKANLLGQKTKKAAIGLDNTSKFLTLSYAMFYEESYEAFKEPLEDFINYLIYWEEEINSYYNMISEKIY